MTRILSILTLLIAATAPTLAFAHDSATMDNFALGFAHPLSGIDHVLAMLGIGVYVSHLASRRVSLLTVAGVLLTLMAGWAIAHGGMNLPMIEPALAASVAVIGAMIFLRDKLPSIVSTPVVLLFALFHGHAHGTELVSAHLGATIFGFISATMLVMLAGYALGSAGRTLIRADVMKARFRQALGGLAAAAGVTMLTSL